MELKDFIGKVVISVQSKRRFIIYEIEAPQIRVVSDKPNQYGHYEFYCWPTINGDPFTNGRLVFEDASLLEPFKEAYEAYCCSEEAYWENYHYWMMRE